MKSPRCIVRNRLKKVAARFGRQFFRINGLLLRPSVARQRALVRADVIVRFHDTAVIKSSVRPGGADEDARFGEIDFERRAPRINVFALLVQFTLTTHKDDNVFRIITRQCFCHISIAAYGEASDAFFVLLKADEEIVHVFVEFGGAGIGAKC